MALAADKPPTPQGPPADRQAGGQEQNGLATLSALVAEDMKAVNALIMNYMHSPVALIPQLAGHIIAAGGKRLRPMLTLASARLCGYQGTRHHNLAACVEFIHTATLLHDDVVDASGLRRGRETANALWGNKPSVLVGDFLFSRAFQIMTADGELKVLKLLSDASAIIAEGEVRQLMTANDLGTTEQDYLDVITGKTAALFEAACAVGAVIAGRGEEDEAHLAAFGRNLGMAFQLVDDILDYSAVEADLGKSIGDDFRDGKMTLPVVIAYQKGDAKERRFWQRCMEEQSFQDGDIDHALSLLRRHEALKAAMERATDYAARAHAAIAPLPASPYKDALTGALDFTVKRAF